MKLGLLLASLCLSMYSYSQECNGYYFLQNNKTIEMTVYGKKGDVSAKQVYSVSGVNKSAGTTTANLASEMFDKNGKSMAKSNSVIKCNGGVMFIDMKCPCL